MFFTRKFNHFLNYASKSFWDLPTPSSISYFWNFGSVLGLCLIIQILSGLFLSFHYISFSSESFNSVSLIMRDVFFGWFIRLIHMNGASMFFVFLYLHIFRGLFFFSFSNKILWLSGCFIFYALMFISFLGYVLPWGQMSYWGVAVITNLLSVFPVLGSSLVEWIWGGFSVDSPTLVRFYSFHFVLPFITFFIVFIHLLLLHQKGSGNPLSLHSNLDKVSFFPYYVIKDLLFYFFILIFFFCLVFYFPYVLSDPVNMIPANFMQTPIHIQPEWYFLPYYSILRSLPSKVSGVICLFMSVLIFMFLVSFSFNFSSSFDFYRKFLFWMFLFSFFSLMKLGSLPASYPFVELGKLWSFLYFFFFLTMNI